MDQDQLSKFLPLHSQVPKGDLLQGVLLIMNACANKFSKSDRTMQMVVNFYEQYYFALYDII